MLSEVGSLWFTASTAIAQALEKLDSDIANASEDGSGHQESLAQVNDDLETYKKLLDDAQMQHLELSKQSRLLIAEKDAEIKHLKAQLSPSSNPASSTLETEKEASENIELLLQKALSEKAVLESSLREVEVQLRAAVHSKNELHALTKSYEELKKRHEIMKDDFTKLRYESDVLEKQRTETIENLASEYSRLAAEMELVRQQNDARVSEVLKENEVLVTKMHALEHSITELADRATVGNHNHTAGDNSNNNGSPKRLLSSPERSTSVSSTASGSKPFPMGSTKATLDKEKQEALVIQTIIQDNPALISELKEVKAKLVNVQFDLKQRDDELQRIKAEQVASTSSVSTANEQAMLLAHLQDKLHTLESDKATWKEQTNASQEKSNALNQEVARLQDELAQQKALFLQKVASKDDSTSHLTEELTQKLHLYESKLQQLQQEKILAETSYLEEKQQLEVKITTYTQEIVTLQATLANLQTENTALQANLRAKEQQFSELEAASMVEKQQLEAQLSLLKDTMSQDKENANISFLQQIQTLDTQLQDLKVEKQALEASFQQEKLALQEHYVSEARLSTETAFRDEREKADKQLTELTNTFQVEKEKLEQKILSLENELVSLKTTHKQEIVSLKEANVVLLEEEHQKMNAEHEKDKLVALKLAEETANQKLANSLATQLQSCQSEMQTALQAMEEKMLSEKENALQSLIQEHTEQLNLKIQSLSDVKDVEKAQALAALAEEKDAAKQAELVLVLAEKDKQYELTLAQVRSAHEVALQTLKTEKELEIQAISMAMQKIQDELRVVEEKNEAKLLSSLASLREEKDLEKAQAISATKQEMQTLVTQANQARDEHLANYTKERVLRKRIHNKLLEIQGNIRVICRIRPINDVERRSGEDVDITEIINEEEFYVLRDAQSKTKFEYDRVFPQTSTQQEVFESVQPLCVSVLDGYNVCIFAYGQTGSGKTFTMEGYDDPGVTPRALMELFNQLTQLSGEWTYTLTLSILEIYNESIHDLLNNSNAGKDKEKLDIRQTAEGNVVPGLTEVPITNMEQVNELMRQGKSNRAVGKHDMNEHSSRSHSIVTVTARGVNRMDNATTFGKLHLIDLAGSERISKTDATGDRLKEAQNINKSLLALGDVINALGNKKALHVPYRNSKLTFLLQDSLGGNSKVLMFVNISPAVYNLGETVCSLNFASKCRATELGQAKKQTGPTGSSGGGMSSSSESNVTGGEGASAAKQLLAEKRRALMSPSASTSNLLASSSKKF